jgi:hypothetical protein
LTPGPEPLARPGDAELAAAFYAERQREAVERHAAWAAELLDIARRWSPRVPLRRGLEIAGWLLAHGVLGAAPP